MRVSSGIKAVIIQNGSLLTIKKHDDTFGEDYTLPGGGQEFGETLIEALKREVMEEAGLNITVKQLLFLREYIGKNHHEQGINSDIHVVDHLFYCEVVDEGRNVVGGTAPDEDQIGIAWIPVNDLHAYRFFPRGLIQAIVAFTAGTMPNEIYVGDIN